MRVFLDFEATSLSKTSYPIEVGWVFEDGLAEGHLIKPAPGWTDWDERAATIHGITQEQLARDGRPHSEVCRLLVKSLTGHALYARSPSWDGKWLSVLLRSSGYPRHLLRLQDCKEAFVEAAAERLGGGASEEMIARVIANARMIAEASPPGHRAVADARREWEIWKAIRGQTH
jgi:hypothetical protein